MRRAADPVEKPSDYDLLPTDLYFIILRLASIRSFKCCANGGFIIFLLQLGYSGRQPIHKKLSSVWCTLKCDVLVGCHYHVTTVSAANASNAPRWYQPLLPRCDAGRSPSNLPQLVTQSLPFRSKGYIVARSVI